MNTSALDRTKNALDRIDHATGMFVYGYVLGASCAAFVVYAILKW